MTEEKRYFHKDIMSLTNIDPDTYFKPDVSNLSIGYECLRWHFGEYTSTGTWNYIPHVIGYDDLKMIHDMKDDPNLLGLYYRTPYLTQKQIDDQTGWKLPYLYFCDLWIEDGMPNLEIYDLYGEQPKYYYQGKCPSINEFRKITSLLNI